MNRAEVRRQEAIQRRAEQVLLTWAEIAYFRQGGPCPYPRHRMSAWLNDADEWSAASATRGWTETREVTGDG